jgi:hypothetical protein
LRTPFRIPIPLVLILGILALVGIIMIGFLILIEMPDAFGTIASLDSMTVTPTPTPTLPPIPFNISPNPQISLGPPLDLSEDELDTMVLNDQKPTIQQVNPGNTLTDIRSILVNYSMSDTVEIDESDDKLTITITPVETEEVPEEEEEPTEVTSLIWS